MKEELTKLFEKVDCNSVAISTPEKPIVGTEGLVTCFGLLLYDSEAHEAIVAHIGVEDDDTHKAIAGYPNIKWYKIVNDALDLIKLDKKRIFKYVIIPGFDSKISDPHKIKEKLIRYLTNTSSDIIEFVPFEDNSNIDIKISLEFLSNQFAFDSRSGKFVSHDVFYGMDYVNINSKSR